MRRSRGQRRDAGVTLIEAAFALPIMLTFIFGLVDLGMWTLNSNQATNAARDGARAAVLDFEQADVVGSAHWNAVVDAVEGRLDRSVQDVAVACVDPSGITITCANARVDLDRIRVDVEWDWTLITPVATILGYENGRASGSSSMILVGRPLPGSTTTTTTTTAPESTTTTTPSECDILSLTVSPDPVARTSNGASQLAEALVVDFTTNGSTACLQLRVRLIPTHDTTPIDALCGCGEGPTSFSYSYKGSANVWKSGQGTVHIMIGTAILESKTFTVS